MTTLIFHALIGILWVALFGWWIARQPRRWWHLPILFIASFGAVAVAAPGVWEGVFARYPGDSFWALSAVDRVGVAVISACGFVLTFAVIATRPFGMLRAGAILQLLSEMLFGILIYALAYSISPLVYDSFYRRTFAGLTKPAATASPLDIARLRDVALLRPDAPMADHLAGLGLWAVLPFCLWLHLRRSR